MNFWFIYFYKTNYKMKTQRKYQKENKNLRIIISKQNCVEKWIIETHWKEDLKFYSI